MIKKIFFIFLFPLFLYSQTAVDYQRVKTDTLKSHTLNGEIEIQSRADFHFLAKSDSIQSSTPASVVRVIDTLSAIMLQLDNALDTIYLKGIRHITDGYGATVTRYNNYDIQVKGDTTNDYSTASQTGFYKYSDFARTAFKDESNTFATGTTQTMPRADTDSSNNTIWGGKKVDESDFMIVVFPDIQNMVESYPAVWYTMPNFVADNKTLLNIKAVIGLGDNVDDPVDSQYTVSKAGWDIVDGTALPYIFTIGNHDYDSAAIAARTASKWDSYFPITRFSGKSWFEGSYQDSTLNYCINLDVGTHQFLIISLETFPRMVALNWADSVITANTTKKVIIVTHSYISNNGRRTLATDPDGADSYGLGADNDGQEMWDSLIINHNNIILILNGHHICTPTSAHSVDVTDGGALVNQVFCNHQCEALGGNGYMMLLKFQPSLGRIAVTTYSDTLGTYDSTGAYTLTYDDPIIDATIASQFPITTANSLITNRSLTVNGSALINGNSDFIYNEADSSLRIRHENKTQGIGIGYNTVRAIGTNTSQGLNILTKGSGSLLLGTTGSSTSDSSLVLSFSSGSPRLNFYGTDGNNWNLGINTSDSALFASALAYKFDAPIVAVGKIRSQGIGTGNSLEGVGASSNLQIIHSLSDTVGFLNSAGGYAFRNTANTSDVFRITSAGSSSSNGSSSGGELLHEINNSATRAANNRSSLALRLSGNSNSRFRLRHVQTDGTDDNSYFDMQQPNGSTIMVMTRAGAMTLGSVSGTGTGTLNSGAITAGGNSLFANLRTGSASSALIDSITQGNASDSNAVNIIINGSTAKYRTLQTAYGGNKIWDDDDDTLSFGSTSDTLTVGSGDAVVNTYIKNTIVTDTMITILIAGIYNVDYSVSFEAIGAGLTTHAYLYENDVKDSNVGLERTITAGSVAGSASFNNQKYYATSTTLKVKYTSDTGSRTLRIMHHQFRVTRID